jgi:hypothetical protein
LQHYRLDRAKIKIRLGTTKKNNLRRPNYINKFNLIIK